jgi:hypothetical protein
MEPLPDEPQLAERIASTVAVMADLSLSPVPMADVQHLRGHVRIRFSRALGGNGELWLSATSEFLQEFAGSLLGKPPSSVDPIGEGQLALVELANVCGGEMLMMLGSETDLFELDLPEFMADRVDDPCDGMASISCAALRAGRGYLRVHVGVDPEMLSTVSAAP